MGAQRGGGRPPGRQLSPLEARHLQTLLRLRLEAERFAIVRSEEIEDFVLELRESGASVRSIADAIGVAPTTVQGWTANARARHPS
jgi:hypothetical protein